MDFSLGSIIANLVFGTVGFWLLNRGRKSANFNFVINGILLMVYPIFITGVLNNWIVGFGICGLSYWIEKKS